MYRQCQEKRDDSYQAVGRAFEILGQDDAALRNYWRALLSGEALKGPIWTYSLSSDEIARVSRRSKKWEDVLVVATIARRSDRPKKAFLRRMERYESEAMNNLSRDRLIDELGRAYGRKKIAADVRKRVEGYLDDLASDDAAVRDDSTRALRQMGATISPLLAPLIKDKNKERAARVRSILEPWAVDVLLRRRLDSLPWP